MLRSLKAIRNSSINATDGEIGEIYNFLLDDVSWRIPYLVVQTGTWLNRHKVLLSPSALGRPDWSLKTMPVTLTREQVRSSPDVDTDQPVSRQQEIALSKYYGWTTRYDMPYVSLDDYLIGDPHLRSFRELVGYSVTAHGVNLGEVEDFILDDRSWSVRYIIVHTGVKSGGQVLMLPTNKPGDISFSYRRLELNAALEDL
jgi:sporulation protein YlmC with PRC-barrel domain